MINPPRRGFPATRLNQASYPSFALHISRKQLKTKVFTDDE